MWISASLIGSLLVVTPIYLSNNQDYYASPTSTIPDLEITQYKSYRKFSYVEVPLTVRNVTKRTVETALIECDALRSDGGLADTASVSFNDIKANQSVHDIAVLLHVDKTGMTIECKPA